MAETPNTETADEVIRRRLGEIRQWQREGKSAGWITKQLGIARSSYQRVLPQVEAEKVEAQDVLHGDEGTSTTTEALTRQVYTGRQTSDSDAAIALPEQISRLLPALREMSELLPTIRELQSMMPRLKPMLDRELERQALAEMPEDYEKFIATYSVRLSPQLIEDIKAYAKRHRLSQSQVATTAFFQLIRRD